MRTHGKEAVRHIPEPSEQYTKLYADKGAEIPSTRARSLCERPDRSYKAGLSELVFTRAVCGVCTSGIRKSRAIPALSVRSWKRQVKRACARISGKHAAENQIWERCFAPDDSVTVRTGAPAAPQDAGGQQELNASQQCTLPVTEPKRAASARAWPAAGGQGSLPALLPSRPRLQTAAHFWGPPNKTSTYPSEPKGLEHRRCRKRLREPFSPEKGQVMTGIVADGDRVGLRDSQQKKKSLRSQNGGKF